MAMGSINRINRRIRAVLVAAAGWSTWGLAHGVGAATITWDGGAHDFQWSSAANWSGNDEPTIADDVVFPATVPDGIGSIQLSGGEAARSITFNENYDLSF